MSQTTCPPAHQKWNTNPSLVPQIGPAYRSANYHKLTFSMAYFGNERYLLPLSHDEVVHGKATIAQKMAAPGVEDKLAQARALYLYMFAHPGKKLNFMGWEVAQLREWDERREPGHPGNADVPLGGPSHLRRGDWRGDDVGI